MKGLLGSFTAPNHSMLSYIVKIQVTGGWYKQTHVRGTMLTTTCIPVPFWGVQKVSYFLCFIIKKHHLKIFKESFSIQKSLNAGATHFKHAGDLQKLPMSHVTCAAHDFMVFCCSEENMVL